MTQKICKLCNKSKPATTEYFHEQKGGKLGLRAACIPCYARRQKAYEDSNPKLQAGRKAYGKRYYRENKEKLKTYFERYREQNREYYKEYQKANKDKIKAQQKRYYEKNKEKLKTYQKRYYQANKEKLKAQQKQYRAKQEVKRGESVE